MRNYLYFSVIWLKKTYLFVLEPAPEPAVAPVGLETALKEVGATMLFRSNSEVNELLSESYMCHGLVC